MAKYENGYIPKIDYWFERYMEATTESQKSYAAEKMAYFIKRQKEVYGGIKVG